MTGQSPLSPAKPELRPYQREVMERFRAEVAAGRRCVLLVAPTGSGKTVIAGAIWHRPARWGASRRAG